MDPADALNSYNQAYSRLGHTPGSLPTAAHGRFELPPLIAAEQAGLSPGLALGAGLQHAALSARPLPGMNYGHTLHSQQLLDSLGQYKSVAGQPGFTFDPSGRPAVSEQQLYSGLSRLPTSASPGSGSHSKPLFTQTFPSSLPPQSPLIDTSPKGWSLSNFVPPPSNPFGANIPTDLSVSEQLSQPPPAHSSKRASTIQRNPYTSPPDMYSLSQPSRSTKSPVSTSQHFQFSDRIVDVRSSGTHQLHTPRSIEDIVTNSNQSQQDPVKSDASYVMNYDPVSPATPLSDAGQNEPYVSLQDLASISSTQDKLPEHPRQKIIEEPSQSSMLLEKLKSSNLQTMSHQMLLELASSHKGKTTALPSISDMYSAQISNLQNPHSSQGIARKQSPMDQSPISVGGSPQSSAPLGSPQNAMPSSTVVPVPPPVQAQADSTTTKQKRKRKKKSMEMEREGDNMVFAQQMGNSGYGDSYSSGMKNESVFPGNYKRQSSMGETGSNSHIMSNGPNMHGSTGNMQDGFIATSQGVMTSNGISRGQQPSVSLGNMSTNKMMQQQSPLMGPGHQQSSPLMSQQQPSPMMGAKQSPLMAQNQTSPYDPQQQSPLSGPYQQSPTVHGNPAPFSMAESMGMNVDPADHFQNSLLNAHSQVMDPYGNDNPAEMAQAFLGGNADPAFASQIVMARPIQMANPNDSFQDSSADGVYATNEYGGAFINPNLMSMQEQMDSMQGPTSTIDEAALSSIMDTPFSHESSPDKKVEQKQMINPAEEDEEFSHLAQPPPDPEADKNKSKSRTSAIKGFKSNPAFKTESGGFEKPPSPPKPPSKPVAKSGSSFMDSFLNFLQGKKPETLSSMSSAIIHEKPQLPKYIPEPPRPKPVVTNTKPESVSGDSSRRDLSSPSISAMTFSDDEEDDNSNNVHSAVQNVLSNLNDDNDKVKISTTKTGGLTVKINLTKVKEATSKLKSPKQKSKKSKSKKSKSKSRHEVHRSGSYSSGDEVYAPAQVVEDVPVIEEEELLQPRQMSSRKAKEKAQSKKTFAAEEDEDSDTLKEIRASHHVDVEKDYDSDDDPAWTPFAIDRKQPLLDLEEEFPRRKRKTPKSKKSSSSRSRSRKSSGSSSRRSSTISQDQLELIPPVAKVQKIEVSESEDDDDDSDIQAVSSLPPLQVGDFVMEKKDLKNYESYPIWKIENGRMLHKFELYTEDGKILHRAVSTFSSWLPSMRNQFVHVRVQRHNRYTEKETVEVLEEDRPKPAIDSQKENEYEENPLVDSFNVYMQIFLSQALEPGFLSAIRDSNEDYYLSHLDRIDNLIHKRLGEIDAKVRWRLKFKECVKLRPHIRELDRPNLKQSCQASEFASQPAIKSVHLFGNPYDRFTLDDIASTAGPTSQEFMIGKTASRYVGRYHNLYHFKYNLYKRCLAKIKILKDSHDELDNPAILDQCLQNRTWVLQIFEDLKKMLEKG